MKLNYEICIVGENVVLVPYRPEHVERYHEWMKSPFLLEMTGSEPLSLEEEVEMQQTWKDDDDKCTFILLSKEKCAQHLHVYEDKYLPPTFITSTLHSMIGDVNLFLSEVDDSEDEDDGNKNNAICTNVKRKQAELDIMIAEPDQRGKGIGKEAVCLMMLYGAQYLNISRFFVKIKEENQASRNLFEKSLHFQECNYVECFQEFELELVFDSANDAVDGIRKMYTYDSKIYNTRR